MRVALVAPPFIPVPPVVYGGTELFIARLAEGLKAQGHEVVVYSNGASTVDVERRWFYAEPQWPIFGEIYDNLKDFNHTSWAIRDAVDCCDVIHINNVPGLAFTRFISTPLVYTVHHPHVPGLSEFYGHYPSVHYVTISDFQRSKERMPRMRTIHHGIDTSLYDFHSTSRRYLSFLGRIAPIKGTHLAIEVAKKTGIPLKIAGEVQPVFQDYFDVQIKPHVDGKFIEYVGEVEMEAKTELLSNSLALLFPIQWDEPFGLVMVEAMACGTPVLALPGGSVAEIVRDGVSGYVCKSVQGMAEKAKKLKIAPAVVRKYVEETFGLDRMTSEYVQLYSEILREANSGTPLTEVSNGSRAVA